MSKEHSYILKNLYNKISQGDMLRLCTSIQHLLKIKFLQFVSWFTILLRINLLSTLDMVSNMEEKKCWRILQPLDVIVVLLN